MRPRSPEKKEAQSSIPPTKVSQFDKGRGVKQVKHKDTINRGKDIKVVESIILIVTIA